MTLQELYEAKKALENQIAQAKAEKKQAVKTPIVRLVTSSSYPNVYLDIGSKWVRLNAGPTLDDTGRKALASLRLALNSIGEEVTTITK